jgi:hypothetical protein
MRVRCLVLLLQCKYIYQRGWLTCALNFCSFFSPLSLFSFFVVILLCLVSLLSFFFPAFSSNCSSDSKAKNSLAFILFNSAFSFVDNLVYLLNFVSDDYHCLSIIVSFLLIIFFEENSAFARRALSAIFPV